MGKMKDITGQRFGALVARKPVGKAKSGNTIWLCDCDCGKTHEVVGYALFRGDVVSCGHIAKERTSERNTLDLVGKRFGRLIALRIISQREASGAWIWECQCDCGNLTQVEAAKLRNGTISSCGCFAHELASARLSGERSPFWKGGISFGKYCPKFNETLKEEVRRAFGRTCVVCGAHEEEGRRLAVHHVDYNKVQGCKGMRWSLVPLCASCHSKTNSNRWYWFNKLINYWVEAYELPQ